jgi:hypothetical protein
MANVGDRFPVGSTAPVTGRYTHSACGDTAIFTKTTTLAPCSKLGCPRGDANWILMQQLT